MSALPQVSNALRESEQANNSARAGQQRWNFVISLILSLGGLVMLIPFVWLVVSSLKLEEQIFIFPPEWIPNPVVWQNYPEALLYKPFGLYLFNTLRIVTLNLVAILFSASFVGYGFARIRFWGRDFWFGLVLATLMVPYFVLMVPQFIIFSRMGWVDSYLPLTVPFFFGGGAFNIFLFRQFFRSLPEELADAGRIDGTSEYGIYWRIMLPLCKPALATVAIFTFLAAWNDYIGPLRYLRSDYNFTVAIGLASFRGVMRTEWHLLMAAATAMTVPVVALFFFAQRYFVEGLVLSGIKG
jgi:ABC-type glycerol-3-phosphate transport system permease component